MTTLALQPSTPIMHLAVELPVAIEGSGAFELSRDGVNGDVRPALGVHELLPPGIGGC